MFIFRSVTYWLTLLFLVLIGIASTVSWLYVVPPLKDRLVQQKINSLADRGRQLVQASIAVNASLLPQGVLFFNRTTSHLHRYRRSTLS